MCPFEHHVIGPLHSSLCDSNCMIHVLSSEFQLAKFIKNVNGDRQTKNGMIYLPGSAKTPFLENFSNSSMAPPRGQIAKNHWSIALDKGL